jgi:hypothetical protein
MGLRLTGTVERFHHPDDHAVRPADQLQRIHKDMHQEQAPAVARQIERVRERGAGELEAVPFVSHLHDQALLPNLAADVEGVGAAAGRAVLDGIGAGFREGQFQLGAIIFRETKWLNHVIQHMPCQRDILRCRREGPVHEHGSLRRENAIHGLSGQ